MKAVILATFAVLLVAAFIQEGKAELQERTFWTIEDYCNTPRCQTCINSTTGETDDWCCTNAKECCAATTTAATTTAATTTAATTTAATTTAATTAASDTTIAADATTEEACVCP